MKPSTSNEIAVGMLKGCLLITLAFFGGCVVLLGIGQSLRQEEKPLKDKSVYEMDDIELNSMLEAQEDKVMGKNYPY